MKLSFIDKDGLPLSIQDLDGNPIIEQKATSAAPEIFGRTAVDAKPEIKLTYARALSNILVEGKSDNPLKHYELALQIRNQAEVNVDLSDAELIKNAVKNSQLYTQLVTAQLLKHLLSCS